MNYTEIKITLTEIFPWKDIFTSFLADFGCESFADGETENVLLAYIADTNYNEEEVKKFLENHGFATEIRFEIQHIEQQNWNALWESYYEPVLISERCFIRAPFHEPHLSAQYEIVIEPKMSFGTAHHETTAMMLEYILDEELTNKSVLDMGAGTGILAILAHKRGAKPITAIDIDEWAYLNNIENNTKNNAEEISVKMGDASLLQNEKYEVIIANINRNILLQDLPVYQKVMENNAVLFLSGFYVGEDFELIQKKCETLGLINVSHKVKNRWCAAKFQQVITF